MMLMINTYDNDAFNEIENFSDDLVLMKVENFILDIIYIRMPIISNLQIKNKYIKSKGNRLDYRSANCATVLSLFIIVVYMSK